MALPKLKHTLYSHTLTGLGKEIKFRPFTNQEQKTLLLAKDSQESPDAQKVMLEAVQQIIHNCTLGKVDGSTLSTFDLEDLFLRIRAKSVGEVINVKYRYDFKDAEDRPVSKFIHASVNIDDVKVKLDPEHEKQFMLTDEVGVVMRYPTFSLIETMKDESDLPMACIESVFTTDEVFSTASITREELVEFYNDIDTAGMLKIKKFFDTMPKLEHSIELDLGDGKKETVTFKGLQDFFH
ncbi:hypothetical protein pf16_156 [Pseudomonas phage pf16]|uniref:Baseplate hub assembly protein n=1 Tax=Pseudomonas phage pf16 TaxID=1815630 RepID=A0A1S5R3V1_9CAUD|nr:hypothetical protein FDG98_gp142 [Pseudomonas phage pf16]AND75079.1 hypothetical protein pf16_156 [Pseudomonas phage pf16]